jgi:aldehyde:ferredoxin oxidoreductase
MWKILRINMSDLKITEEPFKEKYAGLGGRGLVARVMLDEVPPTCDPWGPDNKLILATTALTGTGLACVNRLSVGCKSPLTLGIKEANVGGTIAASMANHGIRLIIIEGKPSDDGLWTVRVDGRGNGVIEDATGLREMDNYRLVEALLKMHGEDISVASIGVAGERGYLNSTVQVTEFGTNYPSRAAARGGVGSVMGSKKVKAIIVEKAKTRYQPEYSDKKALLQLRSELNRVISEGASRHELQKGGTPQAVKHHHENGMLPVNNFSGKDLPDIDRIYPDSYLKFVAQRGKVGHPCQAGCLVRCSNEFCDAEGKYLTAGMEYETVALCGSNCSITDFDAIARMDRRCDELGLDTIETGATIGVCMDAGRIPWGDAEAAMGLIEEMAQGTELGRLLGSGTEGTGRYFGVAHVPVAHHMAFPGYDIRGAAPTGVAFAGGAQGADHTQCPSAGTGADMSFKEICDLSRNIQTFFGMCDSLICMMASIFLNEHLDKLAALYAAAYGGEATLDRLMTLGVQTLKWEKQFNRAAGWTDADDTVPEFFYKEKSEMTGTTFNVPQEFMSRTVSIE